MKYTYLIKSMQSVVAWHDLISAAFPSFDGQEALFDGHGSIYVTFDSPQTPVNLGPLIKIELVTQ
jgi:hypothetical protein